MTDQKWKNWGYVTNLPCVVCGRLDDCKVEPRFGYVVCREHADTPPNEIHSAGKNEVPKV